MFALLIAASLQGPVLVVDRDDVAITASCVIRVPPGRVIADGNGDGVLHVLTDGITIAFEPGSILRGAPAEAPLDGLEGIGIRVEGVRGVTLRGVQAQGFRCAVLARDAEEFTLEDAVFERNFAQRLKSTPEAEDGGDWLWPHENDAQQWRTQYGAAVALERCLRPQLRRIRVRAQQNGILLDRVQHARISDNDCSFLSGWGLALWRSSDNLISRNAFDFCIRGYSHGVYNRGQDSAGILMFEQCSRNHFLENSATHGGDGFFGFAGKEALGEKAPERPDFEHREAGCNANWFVGNDFSFAAAHGLELTFSFHNRIFDNLMEGNAICGMWLGFCQQTLIARNRIESNGDAGYGLERGGINVDQSRGNAIVQNRFLRNACGVHLWRQPGAFADRPWGKANRLDGTGNVIALNEFTGDAVAVQLRGEIQADMFLNQFASVPEETRVEETARVRDAVGPLPVLPAPRREPIGDTRPVGARKHLRGRDKILMGEWGPWDHSAPLVQRLPGGGGAHEYWVLPPALRPTAVVREGAVRAEWIEAPGGRRLRIEAEAEGWTTYRVELRGDGLDRALTGSLLRTSWEVACFATEFDPREDAARWQRAAASALAAASFRLPALRLAYGGGGPGDLAEVRSAVGDAQAALPGRERFGTVARTRVRLPEGRWRIRTTSDDGVRVRTSTQSAPVIENWTWHGPTEDVGEFGVDAAAANDAAGVEIYVEHFELDGWAVLELVLEPAS